MWPFDGRTYKKYNIMMIRCGSGYTDIYGDHHRDNNDSFHMEYDRIWKRHLPLVKNGKIYVRKGLRFDSDVSLEYVLDKYSEYDILKKKMEKDE